MSTFNGPEDFLARGLTPVTAATPQNSDRGDNEECFICSEPYTETTTDADGNATTTVNDEAVALPCGHIFGRECITAWVGTANANASASSSQGVTCPTCRATLFQFGNGQGNGQGNWPGNGQQFGAAQQPGAMQPMGAGQQVGADQQFDIQPGNAIPTGVTTEQWNQLVNFMQQLGVWTNAEEVLTGLSDDEEEEDTNEENGDEGNDDQEDGEEGDDDEDI